MRSEVSRGTRPHRERAGPRATKCFTLGRQPAHHNERRCPQCRLQAPGAAAEPRAQASTRTRNLCRPEDPVPWQRPAHVPGVAILPRPAREGPDRLGHGGHGHRREIRRPEREPGYLPARLGPAPIAGVPGSRACTWPTASCCMRRARPWPSPWPAATPNLDPLSSIQVTLLRRIRALSEAAPGGNAWIAPCCASSTPLSLACEIELERAGAPTACIVSRETGSGMA